MEDDRDLGPQPDVFTVERVAVRCPQCGWNSIFMTEDDADRSAASHRCGPHGYISMGNNTIVSGSPQFTTSKG